MFWKLISVFVGSHWRTFCGLSPDDFLAVAKAALDELGFGYSVEEIETTQSEQTMLGADETGVRLVVFHPVSFDVDIITATLDPVTKFAMTFFVTERRREELTADLCVVTVNKVTDETRPSVARFMTLVMETSDRPPWKLTHHIGFRLAVLLRLKVRVLWTYWRRVAETQAEGIKTEI